MATSPYILLCIVWLSKLISNDKKWNGIISFMIIFVQKFYSISKYECPALIESLFDTFLYNRLLHIFCYKFGVPRPRNVIIAFALTWSFWKGNLQKIEREGTTASWTCHNSHLFHDKHVDGKANHPDYIFHFTFVLLFDGCTRDCAQTL